MKKILVTGGSGLLGSKVVSLAESEYQVIPTHFKDSLFLNSVRLDITNKREVFQNIQKFRPDIVIHAAAETNVDKCEKEKQRAWKTNVEGTSNLAEICGRMNAKMIYVSTDYVFDGEKGLYAEEDEPNPVNYYGLTKLKGEELLAKCCEDYIIVRTSVLYGWNPRKLNFATWIIDSLRHKLKIQVVDDHFNSPTLADNLAQALVETLEKGLSGLFHMAGSERTSRYEFSVKVAETFNLDTSLIKPIKMNELKAWIAKRPRDSSLNVEKAKKVLKTKFWNVQESLNIMKTKPKIEFSNFKK